jgi:L,D-peptidoglycan transpeptidase YkuD (ErfK/YbiS/YcfS/YnhG family)
MNIIIKNRLLLYRGYKLKCAIGKSGITNSKKEGDQRTPSGMYKLGILYYRKDRNRLLKTKLRKKVIKKNMGWCDDPRSKKYNKEIRFPFNYSAEKLYKKNKTYDILIDIKYNHSPVEKNKGSAIFLHLKDKNYNPTKGCISISKKDFLKLLPLIKRSTRIIIKR